MFTLNEDKSIYATRGDIVFFSVAMDDKGVPQKFKAGDVVHFKVYGKKDTENVVLHKKFPVTAETDTVQIYLERADTKIGDYISKPKDYWYSVTLNDDTNPQTIIGYDEDGAKVFKLFPEGADIPPYEPIKPEDIPVVDMELDMTSERPVENKAIARAVVRLNAELDETNKEFSKRAAQTDINVASVAGDVAVERARLDNLIDRKDAEITQTLSYMEYITDETKSKLSAMIHADGVVATIRVIFHEANQFYGGSGMNVFIIPNECKPVDVGVIHTEDGIRYSILYDTENDRYVMELYAEDGALTAPSAAGFVLMTYNLSDYELKDIRVGADGVTYDSAGTSVREQISSVVDQLSIVHDSIYKKTALNLPSEYYGRVKVTIKNGGRIISGTNNVVALMGLAQGTFTHNGVTIQIEGNTVTAEGTAGANVYFSLHTGEADSTGSLLISGEAKLPERAYTISEKVMEGSVFPPFSIRGKSGGNIVTAQNNTAQFEYSVETCGHPYLYFTSGRSYNCKLVLGLFPYETNIYDENVEQTSSVSVFKTSGVYNANGYTWASGTATAEAVEDVTAELTKKCRCRYEKRSVAYTGADEVLDIYIPAKVGYTHLLFGRSVYEPNNADVWRIIQFSAVDDGFGERYKITQFGETEMAVKIAGRDDFIGGYTHGDEITVPESVVFIMDGAKINPTTLTEMTDFAELRISEASTMFDPADHTTKVGTHGKEYVITEDGVAINQVVKWEGAYTLDASYMPMLCAVRGNDKVSDLQITDTYIDNGDYMPYDVGESGFTTYPNTKKAGVDKVTLFSDKSGLCATVEVLETPDLPGAISFLYNGEDTYNKIYFAVCGYGEPHITKKGEKWRVRAKIQTEIGNGN